MTCRWLVLSLFVATAVARGDVLYLQQGGQVEGQLLNPDQAPRQHYLMQTAEGVKLAVPAEQVERAVVKTEAERRYEAYVATLPDTAAAHWDAARKCEVAGLSDQRIHHLEQVVRLEPDHADARHALGYSRVDGRWIRRSEAMEEKGYVRAGGSWRLPQELELKSAEDEYEQKRVQWRRDLKMWREWIIKGRDPQKVMQGEQSIRGIHDPLAAVPLVELLKRDREPAPLRLLYIDVLAQLNSVDSLVALVRHALEDRDPNVREKCIDKLARAKSKAAVRQFMKTLKHDENILVNRAAAALSRMQDPEATPDLIDALITSHKFVEGSSGMTPTFTGDGGAGLSMGGGQKVVRRKLQNDPVLRALTVLNPGVNFGFDQTRWKAWYRAQNAPQMITSLRRDD